jgi:hypothetical protein
MASTNHRTAAAVESGPGVHSEAERAAARDGGAPAGATTAAQPVRNPANTPVSPASGPGVHSDPKAGTTAGRSPLFYTAVAAVNRQVTRDDAEPYVDHLSSIRDNVDALIRRAADPIVAPALAILAGLAPAGWEPARSVPPGIFRDLRPSEALTLRHLVEDAIGELVDEWTTRVAQRLGDVVVTFAELHPDAQRAER